MKWVSSWDYGTFRPPKTHSSYAHVQPSSGARCLIFGRTLRLLPYFMCANSEGSDGTARMHRLPEPSLVAYVISTIISWVGSNCISVWSDAQKSMNGATVKFSSGLFCVAVCENVYCIADYEYIYYFMLRRQFPNSLVAYLLHISLRPVGLRTQTHKWEKSFFDS